MESAEIVDAKKRIDRLKLEELCPPEYWMDGTFACPGGPYIFRLKDSQERGGESESCEEQSPSERFSLILDLVNFSLTRY